MTNPNFVSLDNANSSASISTEGYECVLSLAFPARKPVMSAVMLAC